MSGSPGVAYSYRMRRQLTLLLLLLAGVHIVCGQDPVTHYSQLPKYRKHRLGLSVGAGAGFLLPDQKPGLAALLEVYYCKDIGRHWLAETGAGVRLTSLHTRFNLDWANHEDSTAEINSLSIPLRIKYVLPKWNLAPSAGISFERNLGTTIAIDSVEQGKNGAWLQQRRYRDSQATASDNLLLQFGLAYLAPNRRAALGIVYSRNLLDWAKRDYPEAFAWQLGLCVEITFGLKKRRNI
jgi:hypothetical protein